MKVAIVGGGIVGLSTALNLQNELRDVKITIFANSFQETTSHVAAGIFRVGTLFSGPTDEITWQATDKSSKKVFLHKRQTCLFTFYIRCNRLSIIIINLNLN